jgi:nucleotide-binding universal stress UspA family protein
MYTSIYAPLDNSDHSNAAMDLTVALGKAYGARVTGSHIYAAALHDVRFKQMEFTLPDEYKEETELEKQRRIHDTLITRGLQLISDSYLAPMAALAEDAGVTFEGKTFDGKNFEQIVNDIHDSDYDLVILGALGQGAVKPSRAGSVCERTLRRTAVDTFVVRDALANELDGSDAIVVALDGSAWSWGAFKSACSMAAVTERPLEIVVVHEPDSPADELLEAHQAMARKVAKSRGVKVRTTALEGQASEALLEYVERTSPWLLAIGRHGIDAGEGELEVGSLTEHVIRFSGSNVLVGGTEWRPTTEDDSVRAAA